MDIERARKLLREAQELGVRVVDLTGGEPSMHPDFSIIVGHALSLGFERLNISTNGYALDIQTLRKLDSSRIHCFISMDGISEEVVRRIRGEDVAKLMKLFEELKHLKLEFSLRFCLNALNWMETAEMLAFVRDIGVNADFEPTQIVGNAGKDLALSCEQIAHIRRAIVDFPKSSIIIEDSFIAPIPCDGGQSDLLSINTDGIATVCLMFGPNTRVISENVPLKKMWDTLFLYKERMRNFQPILEKCDGCWYYALCCSGCRATAYAQQCFNPWEKGEYSWQPIELSLMT